MRPSYIFLMVLLIPALWVGGSDLLTSRNGDPRAGASTLGDVWLHTHRESYMKFRNDYLGRPEVWKTDVLPYLEMKAVPVLLGPGVVWLVILVLGRLLGWRRYGGRERYSETTSPFGRGHIHNKHHDLKYKRK